MTCKIKISKQGKYYLTENGKRLTEDQSYIEKISDIYFAFKNFDGMFAEGLSIGDEVDQNIGIEKHF